MPACKLIIKKSILLHVAIGLFVLYNLQGILYTSGSIISQVALFLCILVGVYYWIKSLGYGKRNILVLIISCFLLLNGLGFMFYSGYYSSLAFNQLKGVLSCFLPFFIGFYLTTKQEITPKIFENLFYVLLVVNILSFYRFQTMLLEEVTGENVVNNISYSFARIIPLLFFVRRNILIRVGLSLVVVFFIALGAKRGAIVTGGVGIFVYLIFLLKGKEAKGCWSRIVMLLFIACFIYLVVWQVSSNDFLLQRFESRNLSGRDRIYSTIFNSWYLSNNITQILFGFGFISSVDLTNGLLAHNDWLEILANFGLIGVCVYLGIFVSLVYILFHATFSVRDKYLFFSIISMWGLTTIFSTWFNSMNNFMLMLVLGHLVSYYTVGKVRYKYDSCG